MIEYHDIYNKDRDITFLAMTVFEKGVVQVFDKENKCIRDIVVPKRTVVIDKSLLRPGNERLELFSGLHESGHVLMHWDVFTYYNEENSNDSVPSFVCCRRDVLEKIRTQKRLQTAEDWREHQANYFAAAIAMPNATFKPFVNRLLRDNGYYKGRIITGVDSDLDILAEDILPDAITEVYGVSRRAARIQLEKCGFVVKGNIGKP